MQGIYCLIHWGYSEMIETCAKQASGEKYHSDIVQLELLSECSLSHNPGIVTYLGKRRDLWFYNLPVA